VTTLRFLDLGSKSCYWVTHPLIDAPPYLMRRCYKERANNEREAARGVHRTVGLARTEDKVLYTSLFYWHLEALERHGHILVVLRHNTGQWLPRVKSNVLVNRAKTSSMPEALSVSRDIVLLSHSPWLRRESVFVSRLSIWPNTNLPIGLWDTCV